MSKDVKGILEDQEFAFSKYGTTANKTEALSDFRAHNLDLMDHEEVSRPALITKEFNTWNAQSDNGLTNIGQIDLSDLKIMREQLNKIIETPNNSFNELKENHSTDGLGDLSLFVGFSDQKVRSENYTLTGADVEDFSHSKMPSQKGPISYKEKKEFDDNVSGVWNFSDAELLARAYETTENFSDPHNPSKNESYFDSSGNQNLKFPTSRTVSNYKKQESGEAIADQQWLSRISRSGEEKSQENRKTSSQFSRPEETIKQYLELFWQRMNLVLRDMAMQTEAQTKQLLGKQSKEFVLHREKLEKQIFNVEDVVRKIYSTLEKIQLKAPDHPSKVSQSEADDLKSVLSSIDKDLEQTFNFNLGMSSHENGSFYSQKDTRSRVEMYSAQQNDQVTAMLESLQKILIRLLDRLDSDQYSNSNPSQITGPLFQSDNKKLKLEVKNLLPKLKNPSAISKVDSKFEGYFSKFFARRAGGASLKKGSSPFSLQKNSQITVLSLAFVIALSSFSLIMNSKKSISSQVSQISLTSEGEMMSENKEHVFGRADLPLTSFSSHSPQMGTLYENNVADSPSPPAVTDEFFKLATISSGHF